MNLYTFISKRKLVLIPWILHFILGAQYKVIVEYAPSQRVPKPCAKKDGREGTIYKGSYDVHMPTDVWIAPELLG